MKFSERRLIQRIVSVISISYKSSYLFSRLSCQSNAHISTGAADGTLTHQLENVTLLTEALVKQLHTNDSGSEVTAVSAEVEGEEQLFSAGIVVVACGSINSMDSSTQQVLPFGLYPRSIQRLAMSLA